MERSVLLQGLADRIAAVAADHPLRTAIDGVDAAGKTVLADELAPLIAALGRPVIRASIDGFHNPAAVRRRRGDSSPDGYYRDSFDYEALMRELLAPLGPGGDCRYRPVVFDFRTDSVIEADAETASPDAILLFDGVFLLRPELRGYWDFSVFVRVAFDVTVARAESRDGYLFGSAADVRARYESRYVPGQRLYLSEADPESHADIVVDNDDYAAPSFVLPT